MLSRRRAKQQIYFHKHLAKQYIELDYRTYYGTYTCFTR
nr:MAG TPA: hypothetical protein [Caudoviricetes sp.]